MRCKPTVLVGIKQMIRIIGASNKFDCCPLIECMQHDFNWEFNGRRFHGITWQPEHYDRVMVVIHGIGEHVERYAPLAEFFNKEGYLVTGIDHYGHGKSDGKRGDTLKLEEIFDYLEAFLQFTWDAHPAPMVLYGHSMGGGLLTGLLLRRQPDVQAAVISAPALLLPQKPNAFLRGILKTGASLLPHLRVKTPLDIQKISHDANEVAKFESDPLRHPFASLRLMHILVSNGLWCLRHADRLQIPSLLMHGNADSFTSVDGSRRFAEMAPKKLITYKEWDGLYHEMHNEPQRPEIFQFMAGWLSAVQLHPLD